MENKVNEEISIVGGEVLTDEMLAAIVEKSRDEKGFFANIGHEAGVLDSPLKIGGKEAQLETDAVIKRLLHINAANITRAVDDDGVASDFAVVTFDEYPFPLYYQAGGRVTDLVLAWASSCGDDFTTNVETKGNKRVLNFVGDRLLPKLNENFNEHGHPFIVLNWKKGKRQEYVDILTCGG